METELIFEGDLGGVFNPETDQTISVHEEVEVEPVETEVGVDDMQLGLEEIPEEAQQIIVEEDTLANTIQLLPPAQSVEIPQETEASLEDQLRSTERLDRSSPDLWPQNLPTAALHLLAKNQPKTGGNDNTGIWTQGLDPEDINLLHQFGSLTSASLVEEVKKLQNIAYQLGLEEAKEMTRGKLLHVLDDTGYNGSLEKESHVQRLWK
ncbi:unnamed protein product [Allacma fusca]|uniref:Uncharacterized protein n=1 Tax=Allacma fusca TaxID=39272 RepID=A0A8J2KL91_9HEXA|nr:unnamed protein product [Allacma fusca]